MECPNCGLLNPADGVRCNCGYDFGSPGVPPDMSGFDLPPDATDPSEVWDNCDLRGYPSDDCDL
jgi:hypothetical protein